jgi:excisionase family DNA binding protein
MADARVKYIKISEVVEISSCSKRHVMEEIKRKNLRAYKPGKELIFDPADVEKWIKRKAVS